MAAFPTSGVPEFDVVGDPMERAIVHAIARQESAFDPTATSHAGARGLMQMMPATARETARRASLPFDWPRLGSDPLYSAQMGAAHLNDLLKEWRGSYILTFAAYNAGSGNVRRWIAAYGDPRSPEVDAVDWVERIPFYETRNYVQRVMENLQVYRQRLNQRTAYLIDHDLKRGGRRE
jgi:soluble lytic murein transglycosylase